MLLGYLNLAHRVNKVIPPQYHIYMMVNSVCPHWLLNPTEQDLLRFPHSSAVMGKSRTQLLAWHHLQIATPRRPDPCYAPGWDELQPGVSQSDNAVSAR